MQQFFDEVWLVVSPQNPFKVNHSLAPVELRIAWARKVLQEEKYIKVSDVETKLPLPSYTEQTLNNLKMQYPDNKFSLIMGADNLPRFHQWKNYRSIIHQYHIYIYNRSSKSDYILLHPNIIYTRSPLLDVSATAVRSQFLNGQLHPHLIDPLIYDEVQNFYQHGQ